MTMNWLMQCFRNNSQPRRTGAPRPRSCRLALEALEDRLQMTTGLAGHSLLAGALTPPSAALHSHHGHIHHSPTHHHSAIHADDSLRQTAASSLTLVGPYSSDGWDANGDSVYFFALKYTGKLTAATAERAWVNGFHQAEGSNIALNFANSDIGAHTTATQHFLIGYHDSSSDTGGWIAADSNPDGTLHYFVGRPGLSASDNEHSTDVTKTFSDNGTTFQMEVTATSGGHLVGSFSQPM
jgi:hypothetical protein